MTADELKDLHRRAEVARSQCNRTCGCKHCEDDHDEDIQPFDDLIDHIYTLYTDALRSEAK